MTTRQKRAGRKPRGPAAGKSENFSTRITAETRAALEAEKVESGQSISQVAERFLKLGIEENRSRSLQQPTRALAFLLEHLSRTCVFIREDDKLCDWRNDLFVFEAFKLATNMLLERLRPEEKLRLPKEIDGIPTERTAQQHAEFAFGAIWRGILDSKPSSVKEINGMVEAKGHRPLPPVATASWSKMSYAIDDARRDLNIRLGDK